jgi:hypothetical protein
MDMKKTIRFILFTTLFVNFTLAQTAMIKTEALTPHRLTTMGFTTNSVSSGLNNVPEQTYVYLSAWNIGNDEPISSATFTLISKPAASTADLEIINPTWVQFKPDVSGTYSIRLSITTTSGTYDTTTDIYASEFVGVGKFAGTSAAFPQCMSCHSSDPFNFTEIFDRWKVSGHANVFNQQLETSTHYGPSCMACHTTGYNHSLAASNNGFDDIAASLGWSYIAPGNDMKWDSLVTYYPDLVNHATIGCENCHGPGKEHAYGGHIEKISISLDAGNCAQCHDEPWRHNKYSEFENSLHSESVWERTTGSNANTNNLNDCIRCHDGKGFANFTKGLTTNAISWTEADATRITCAACHDPHGNEYEYSLRPVPEGSDTLGNGYQYSIGGTGRLCMNCHKARRDNVSYTQTNVNSSHWGPHSSVQSDVYLGQNAAEFDGVPFISGYHKLVFDNACVDCHMVATTDTGTVTRDRVGGHSWNLYDEENDYFHGTSCVPCHGQINSFDDFIASKDFDDDGTKESITQEIEGLETLLRIQLPPIGIDSIDYTQITTPELKKAYWNYQLIANDGSKGMHNARFAIDVLTKSIIAIGGTVDVEEDEYSSPTQYALIQNYPNPFNPSTKIRYNVPYDSEVKITIYNITGEVVSVLVNAFTKAGLHEVEFNTYGSDLSSGIYFYNIEANAVDRSNSFKETKKMILLK